MRCLLSKCRMGFIFFMSMIVVACGSNDEKLATVSSELNNQCAGLSELNLPHTIIAEAQLVAEGDFVLSDSGFWIEYNQRDKAIANLPAFCRVQAVASPTTESHIAMEIWMPAEDWNGRYYQFAMGGAAGAIDYAMLALRLSEGNAVAATDIGHVGRQADFSWALGHPEKIIDYGYRAHKETSDVAKAIVGQYYARNADYNYFFGCSRGGNSGMISARRYPDDWDGILVGATAGDLTKSFAASTWRYMKQSQNPQGRIDSVKLPAIQRAARASCTADAQMVNGIPADPRFCRYDPAILLCTGDETDECLTAPQIKMLRELYHGPTDLVTGKNHFRVSPTMEAENKLTAEYKVLWEKVAGRISLQAGEFMWVTNPISFAIREDFYRYVVFHDQNWNTTKAKLDDALSLSKNKLVSGENLEDVLGANIDWKAFSKTNTKMLMYYGWADSAALPEVGIGHYNKALDQIGDEAKTQDSLRLFMVPGMGHCSGGPGADTFGQYNRAAADTPSHNIVRALEAWVEKGVAPEKIIATKYVENTPKKGVAFTRPLCVYPKVRVYDGKGDINKASSFECKKGATPQ